MSINSIGGAGSGVSQLMASLLSRVKESESATQTPSVSPSTTSTSADTSNAVTGSTDPTLSDQVIGTLVMMQMDGSTPSSSTSTSTSGSDPVSQAFSSLDSDSDGTISQSELETAITNAGGTTDEADTVFAALGGTSSAGISESTFSQAAQTGAPQPPPGGPGGAHGHHHHHHGGGSGTSASDEAAQIFSSLQTSQDGTVSDDTLAAALGTTDGSTSTTSTTGGSSSSSNDLIAAIDSNGDGSVSQSELTSYLQNLQQQSQGDQSTLATFTQLASQSYNTALGLFGTTSSNQLASA